MQKTSKVREFLDFGYYKYHKIVQWSIMHFRSHVQYRKRLKVGKNSRWSYGCFINAAGGIEIGKNVLIGPYCLIQSVNHRFDSLEIPIEKQGWIKKSISIGDDCWLGAHVLVLPGRKIGKGCIVGAGSVVTADIPPYSVAVGNPAKVIRSRIVQTN